MTNQLPPQGWYPDPQGVTRWWDGQQWTQHTQQAAQQAAQQAPVAQHAAQASRASTKPWFKKKRFIIPGALVALIIIGGALGGGTDTEGDASLVASAEGEEVDESANGEEPKKSKKEEPKGSKGNPAGRGDTVELEGTRYTVEDVERAPEIGDEFFTERANGSYVIVTLTIENKKDETKTFLDEATKLIGGNDKSYSTDSDGTIASSTMDSSPLLFEDMQPDVPKTGTLVFDVPEAAAAGSVLEVSDLFGRGEAYIDLGIK